MSTKKRPDTPKPEKQSRTKKTVTQIETLKMPDGTVDGEYSRSVYVNNELVSFDIDWDKLREHMKKVG